MPSVILAGEAHDVRIIALEHDDVAVVLGATVIEEHDQRGAVRTVARLRGQARESVPSVTGHEVRHGGARAPAGAGGPIYGRPGIPSGVAHPDPADPRTRKP